MAWFISSHAIHDLFVNLSRVVAIACKLHTIDLCDWILTLDILFRDHLSHCLFSIGILELLLKWAWHVGKVPCLILNLVPLERISIVVTKAMGTLCNSEEPANLICWIILWIDCLPSALSLELLRFAQPPSFFPCHLPLHVPVVVRVVVALIGVA